MILLKFQLIGPNGRGNVMAPAVKKCFAENLLVANHLTGIIEIPIFKGDIKLDAKMLLVKIGGIEFPYYNSK